MYRHTFMEVKAARVASLGSELESQVADANAGVPNQPENHRVHITAYHDHRMTRIFHSLLALIASASDRELVKFIE